MEERMGYSFRLQKARNNYAHGELMALPYTESEDMLRWISITLILLLLAALNAKFLNRIKTKVAIPEKLLGHIFGSQKQKMYSDSEEGFLELYRAITGRYRRS